MIPDRIFTNYHIQVLEIFCLGNVTLAVILLYSIFMLHYILEYKKGKPAKFHELVVTSHEAAQCVCPRTAKIQVYAWKLSIFYSDTFPKALNNR